MRHRHCESRRQQLPPSAYRYRASRRLYKLCGASAKSRRRADEETDGNQNAYIFLMGLMSILLHGCVTLRSHSLMRKCSKGIMMKKMLTARSLRGLFTLAVILMAVTVINADNDKLSQRVEGSINTGLYNETVSVEDVKNPDGSRVITTTRKRSLFFGLIKSEETIVEKVKPQKTSPATKIATQG